LNQSVAAEKRRKKTPVGKPGPLQEQRHNNKAAQNLARFCAFIVAVPADFFNPRKSKNSHGKA